MKDVDVPTPNPFITQWLIGSTCERIIRRVCREYANLYRAEVKKRTGELASATHVTVDIEGDRWVGLMTVGDEDTPYAASHEFGTGRTDPEEALPAAHDLNTILDLMANS